MTTRKCTEFDYIHFLIAAQRVFTCTELANCQSTEDTPIAHDSFTRLLQQYPPDTLTLWQEAKKLITKETGILILDDTTLDKPYAQKSELVTRHWSGKHHRVVKGINLQTLLWSDGTALIPCDFAVYDKHLGGKSKPEAFHAMRQTAQTRGFKPTCVLFDSWYSSLANLKLIRRFGWSWFTRLKSNRQVNPDNTGNRPIKEVSIPSSGLTVHLKAYGFIKVFRTVSENGDAEYWATNILDLEEPQRTEFTRKGWGIETYHRGLKQCCGVERAQVRSHRGQFVHILFAIRAFLRLEWNRLSTGMSWYEAKLQVIRHSIREYLKSPKYIMC